jgi:S-adenosylmethionine synthetase
MGRKPETVTRSFYDGNGNKFEKQVELFTWEKLDKTNEIKAAFGLH